MKEIKINTDSKNYSVLVGSEILIEENLNEFSEREILLVIDSNIDSKVKNEISRCMIKVFSFHTEKHAQTNRYSAWNIFRLIKY